MYMACNSLVKTAKEAKVLPSDTVAKADSLSNIQIKNDRAEYKKDSTQHGIKFTAVPSIISLKNMGDPKIIYMNTTDKFVRYTDDFDIFKLNKNNKWIKLDIAYGVRDSFFELKKSEPEVMPLIYMIKENNFKPGKYKLSKEFLIYDRQERKGTNEIIYTTFEIVE